MKNYFENIMNEEQGSKSLSPLSLASTRNIDSTFTPIGRADSRTRGFWPLHLKLEIEEIED
jgi:hypothetical protein